MKGFEGLLIVDVRDGELVLAPLPHIPPPCLSQSVACLGAHWQSRRRTRKRERVENGEMDLAGVARRAPMAHRCHSLDSHGSASSHASIGSITLTSPLDLRLLPWACPVHRSSPMSLELCRQRPIPIDHSFFPI
uniref:Uncharacterized protein n=1 Tax=Oryza nivara TaxID=4536 RepID=A0A0E0HSD6_ORYNI